MRLAVICFTRAGYEKMNMLCRLGLGEISVEGFCKCSALRGQCENYVDESVEEWTGKRFAARDAVLFIGAAGIAVRAAAPFVKSKLTDSPLLVMDNAARHVIPLLSGHAGGANALAVRIAALFGAESVLTTSTDVNNKFAIDVFAVKNGLAIVNKEGIAKVTSRLLDGKTITVGLSEGIEVDEKSYDEFLKRDEGNVRLVRACESGGEISYGGAERNVEGACVGSKRGSDEFGGTSKSNGEDVFDVWIGRREEERKKALLYLKPREIAVGIGCKRGKSVEEILKIALGRLEEAGITLDDIFCVASIDRKKDEGGIIRFAAQNRWEFVTFSAEELERVDGEFSNSGFVKATVGTGSVAERAAVAACKEGGKLVLKKQAENGVTVAAARRRVRLEF